MKLPILLCATSLLAIGCAETPPARTELPSTALPAATPAPTTALTATTPISQASTATAKLDVEDGCKEAIGQIIQAELIDPELPRSLPYRIYLPPCAEEFAGDLPTVYLLHGLARTDAQWDELNADEIAADLVNSSQASPFLIVMPWERLGLDYMETIVDYLIPHISEEYGAHPDDRTIGGISRGAGWALRIGLQHPELFQGIGLHSPAVLVPDIYSVPDWLGAIPLDARPEIWIDIGDRDPLRLSLPELTALFDAAEVPYRFRSYPGEHIESYWEAHVEDYLRWYASMWEEQELKEQPE